MPEESIMMILNSKGRTIEESLNVKITSTYNLGVVLSQNKERR